MKTLPANYKFLFEMDMKKNKKDATRTLIISLVLLAVALIPALIARPLDVFDDSNNPMKLVALVGGLVVYVILHEAVHAIVMLLFGCRDVRFAFKVTYAYAASDEYFFKWPYLTIALAPVVVWGIVLWIVATLVPADWFWTVYTIQLANLTGACGDIFVTWRLARESSKVLIRDSGIDMKVYGPVEN